MDEKKYLCEKIKKCRRRLNLARLIDQSLVWMAIAAVPAILLEAYSLLRPFYYVHRAAFAFVLVGLLGGIVATVRKRTDMKGAAKRIDRFGLKERILTAYEQLEQTGELARLQRADAVRCLREMEAKIRIPLHPARRHLAAFGCAFACLLILAFLPSAVRDQAKEQHILAQQANEEKKELDQLVEEMEKIDTDSLTDEQQEQLAEMLDSLRLSQEELAQVNSQEALDAAKQKLSYKYGQTEAGLSSLAGSLNDSAEAGIASAEALAKAASGSDGSGSKGNSDGSSAGDGSGGGNGSSTGDGSGGGDGSGTGGTESSASGQSGSGGTSGNGSETGTGGNGGSSGTGAGGSGNGNGSGTGSGGGAGSGSGRGSGSGSNQHDYVSIPNDLGDDSALSGQKTGSDNTDYYRAQNGIAWEGSHVSLDSVISEYTQDAYDGLASGKYPAGMEDVIKDYFKNLNE
jgi:hypothetical protein